MYSSLKGQGRLFKGHSNNPRKREVWVFKKLRAKDAEASIQKCERVTKIEAGSGAR